MKKISILGLCLAMGLGATAQVKLAKEVERNTKKNYVEAQKQMTPVFSNAETANDPFPRYVVGRAGFDQYDEMFAKKQLGMTKPQDDITMGNALLGGYTYFMQTLPLDSLPDAKGKVKPRYSKDIINTVAGHFNDFSNSAIYFWTAEQYQKAFDSWQIYVDMCRDPRFAKSIEVPADSMIQNIVFNQALSAYNLPDKPTALAKFKEALSIGEAKKNVYDYALAVAQELDNSDEIVEICKLALPIYGNEDPIYLINIINVYNKTGKYDEAATLLDKAISQNPNDPQLWRVKGYLLEYQEKPDEALDAYKKSYEVDPNYADGAYDYARSIFNKGMRIEEETSPDDYDAVLKNTLLPMYQQAKDILVATREICESDALLDSIDRLMDNVNYKLGQQ